MCCDKFNVTISLLESLCNKTLESCFIIGRDLNLTHWLGDFNWSICTECKNLLKSKPQKLCILKELIDTGEVTFRFPARDRA